jgi:hypothetical protein
MAKLTIWYSVSNGGDGSAYPQWFETRKLAEMDQELMEEGWGEPCTGSISFEGNNIKCLEDITTTEKFIEELDEIIEDKYGYTSKWKIEKAKEFKQELTKTNTKK